MCILSSGAHRGRLTKPDVCIRRHRKAGNVSALPLVPNVCKCTINWTVGSKAAANILHFNNSPFGSPPLAYVEALATALDGAIAANGALWGTSVTYEYVEVIDLSSDTGFSAEGGTTTVGTREGDALPANVAVLASYYVARRYRGGHPRTYFPWFTIADVLTPQTWVTDSLAEADSAFDDIRSAALAASGGGYTTPNQVQVSYILADAYRIDPLVDAIDFTQCDTNIASQRRRDGRH